MVANANIDLNKIAADVSATLIKDFCSKIVDSVTGPIAKNMQKFTTHFNKYLTKLYISNKHVRILSNKAIPLALDDIYVSGQFECEHEIIDDFDLMQRVRDNEKVVIKGDGGLGKTLFVKKLWCALFDNPQGRVPVFIPLREVNEISDLNLEDFIRLTLMPEVNNSEDTFRYFCNRGDFIFLFDGFDEVVEAKRDKLKSQLMRFSKEYLNCGYVITSRVSAAFSPWDQFREYRVRRFDRARTLELIEKIPYGGNKSKFMKKITEAYFGQNESFLSNPLLAIMMLITFNDNPQSSNKMSIFYENAFQTLYSLHDGLKDGYERERVLDKDLFRRMFSHFCLFSYYREATSFNDNEVRVYIKEALNYLNIEVEIDDVIKEFCESTNLLQLEGLQYIFIHRSFQEYFSASCATKEMTDKVDVFLVEFFDRPYDDTFSLAFEIHPELVEKRYIIPKLKTLIQNKSLPKIKSDKSYPYFFVSRAGIEIITMLQPAKASSTKIDALTYVSENPTIAFSRTMLSLYNEENKFDSINKCIHEIVLAHHKEIKSNTRFISRVSKKIAANKKKKTIPVTEISFSETNIEIRSATNVARSSKELIQYKSAIEEESQRLNTLLKGNFKSLRLLAEKIFENDKNRKQSLTDILRGDSIT